MNNFDIARDSIRLAEGSEGSAQRELENYQKSMQYSIDAFKAQIQVLASTTINSDIFKGIVDGGTVAVKVLNQFVKVATTVPGIVTAISGAFALKGFMKTKNVVDMISALSRLKETSTDYVSKAEAIKRAFGSLSKAQQEYVLSTSAMSKLTANQKLFNSKAELENQVEILEETVVAEHNLESATTGSTSAMTKFLAVNGGAIVVLASLAAMFYALYKASKQYSDSLDSATKASEEYDQAKSELDSLNAKSDEAKVKLNELANKYEVKFDGTETIEQMINALSNVKTLELTDKADLETLRAENSELERQISLQSLAVDSANKEARKEAEKFLSLTKTEDLSKTGGKGTDLVVGGGGAYDGGYQTDVITATKNELDAYKTLNAQKKQLLEDYNSETDEKVRENLNLQIEALETQTSSYKEAITKNIQDISAVKSGTTGTALYDEITQLEDAVAHMDLSGASLELSEINSYFDGSSTKNAIRDRLERAMKSLKETDDAGQTLEDTLNKLGVSLGDIGADVSIGTLVDYFSSVEKTAESSWKAIQKNATSVSDLSEALESANADTNWKTIADSVETVSNLATDGMYGTDDFQSFVSLLTGKSYNKFDKNGNAVDLSKIAEKYKKDYEDAEKIAEAYFKNTTDDSKDGEENPISGQAQSLQNAMKALENQGLIKDGKVTKAFKSSADAAKALGKEIGVANMSVEATEQIMHALEAQGKDFKFQGVTYAKENLDNYNIALGNMKELYDSLPQDSELRKELSLKMDDWQATYENAENDLGELSEEAVIQLKFEYDRASLIKARDDLLNGSEYATDEERRNSLSGAVASNKSIIAEDKSRLKDLGFSHDDLMKAEDISKAYQEMVDAQNEVTENVKNGETDKVVADSLEELEKRQEAYEELLNSYTDNTKELSKAIKEGKKAEKEARNKKSDDSKSASSVKPDIPKGEATVEINGKFNASDVESELKALPGEATIEFKAELDDGSLADITAVKEEDGTITYYANIDNATYEVNAVKNDDGTITYYAQTGDVKTKLDGLKESEGTVRYFGNDSSARSKLSGLISSVNSSSGTVGIGASVLQSAYNAVSSFVSWISGRTATINVTTKNSGNPNGAGRGFAKGNAYANGNARIGGTWNTPLPKKWGEKKDNTSLVGEQAPEMIVDPNTNTWELAGENGAEFRKIKRGQIVFSGKQTRELLSSGKTSSRGKTIGGYAYASGNLKGTAHASSKKTSLDVFNEWLQKIFDWIEPRIKNIERSVERWADLAKTAVEANDYSRAKTYYNNAISNEKNLITQNANAESSYLREALAVGNKAVSKKLLSQSAMESIFARLQAGASVDFSGYNEKQQAAIKGMQEYIDKSISSGEAAHKASEELGDLYSSLYKLPIDEANSKIEKLNSSIKSMDTVSSSILKNGLSGISTSVFNAIKSATGISLTSKSDVLSASNSLLDKEVNKAKEVESARKTAYDQATTNYNNAKTNATSSKSDAIKKAKAILNNSTYSKLLTSSQKSTLVNARDGKHFLSLDTKTFTAKQTKNSGFMKAIANYNKSVGDYQAYQTALAQANDNLESARSDYIDSAMDTLEKKSEALTGKLENINSSYEAKRSKYTSAVDKKESEIERKSSAGVKAIASDYKTILDNTHQNLELLKQQYNSALAVLNSAGIDKTSEVYLNAKADVEALGVEINDLIAKQYEYNDTIADLDISKFESLNSILSAIADKYQNLISLAELHGNVGTSEQYEAMIMSSMETVDNLNRSLNTYWGKMDSYMGENGQWRTEMTNSGVSESVINDLSSAIESRDVELVNRILQTYESSGGHQLSGVEDTLSDILDAQNSILSETISQEQYLDEMITARKNEISEYLDYLDDIKSAQEKALELQQAQYELDKAVNNKSVRTWNGSQWVYAADQSAIKSAQKTLDDVKYSQLIDSINNASDQLENLAKSINLYDDNGNLKDDWQSILANAKSMSENLISGIGTSYLDKSAISQQQIDSLEKMINMASMFSTMQTGINVQDLQSSIASGVTTAQSIRNSAMQEVNQTFNISLPNITNESSALQLMNELQSLATKKVQYFN